MGSQFKLDAVPGTLIVVGGRSESWLNVLDRAGWHCRLCDDLREADNLFFETGPSIGIIDLTQDKFSLNGIANLVSSHKQVRWLAFIRESQLDSDTTCQFIVNFCIDFFTAPIPDAQLLNTIGHQLGMLTLEKKVWPNVDVNQAFGLMGESMVMRRLREQVKRVSTTDVSIWINGDSGCGKDSIAKTIHTLSARSKKSFLSIDCSAMNEEHLEVELFGHEAHIDEECLLAKADGGTILLNEIAGMPRSVQLRLLKFLRQGLIYHQGKLKAVDVRILASNTADIEHVIIDGGFHEELYHHINVLQVRVPSLKERGDDILLLANHFLRQYTKEFNAQARSFTPEAERGLYDYHWPGNVRELKNTIKRTVLMSDTVMIDEYQLDLPKLTSTKRSLKTIRERSEKEALIQVLQAHSGHVSIAAKELNISRATMYRLLNKHGLIAESAEVQ